MASAFNISSMRSRHILLRRSQILDHRVISEPHGNSVAFGLKPTLGRTTQLVPVSLKIKLPQRAGVGHRGGEDFILSRNFSLDGNQ